MIRLISILILSNFILLGCSTPKAKVKKKTYKIAKEKHAKQPIYNRVTWVRSSQPLPDRSINTYSAPVIDKIVSYEVKDSDLEEASFVLANLLRYRSYCSSKIKDIPISISMIGTINEIAENIEKTSNIKVVIDHDSREVRFLKRHHVMPDFFG